MAEVMHRSAVLLTLLLSTSLSAFSQQTRKEENDSLVRLLTASRAQLLEESGRTVRKVEGDVIFLHNNTYLYCDTALWCVEGEYIDALGHVQIVQENAILSSDKLHYDIPNDLATFRGTQVQLEDRDSNILRSSNLDYNTRDSVACFRGGGSLRDKKGNVIESVNGRFDSKQSTFTFTDDVEMYSDSAFFFSTSLFYETKVDKATFGKGTKGWYGRNHIRADGGWYDKAAELVCFNEGVYIQTEKYEGWCEELRYDRKTGNARMFRNVEILDSVHNAIAAGGFLDYYDSPRKVILTRNPSIIGVAGKESADSLFLRADTLIYEFKMKCQVPGEIADAEARLKNMEDDAVTNMRANAASAASASKSSGKKGLALKAPPGEGKPSMPAAGAPAADSPAADTPAADTPAESDTLSKEEIMAAACDSLSKADSLFIYDDELVPDSLMMAAMDSVVKNWKDTTSVPFLHGYHNVRMFKSNMQMVCDSMEYSDLDSIMRLYISPVVWKDVTTQMRADSMHFVIRNGTVERGVMLSEAMIVVEQLRERYYHQIKSPEMTGFFAEDGSSLKRFDAIGGAQAIFFMEEDSVITMMNQKEAKIISATFRKGNIQKVLYMDGVKSDVYPVKELWRNDQGKMKLKGFGWYEDRRPADRFAVTSQGVRTSVRSEVLAENQFPLFLYTDIYFPKYMEDILSAINEREPIIWKPRDRTGSSSDDVSHPSRKRGTPLIRETQEDGGDMPVMKRVGSGISGEELIKKE